MSRILYTIFFLLVLCTVACKPKHDPNNDCVYKECDCLDTLAVGDTTHYFPFDRGFTGIAYQYAIPMNAHHIKLIGSDTFPANSILRADTLSAAEMAQLEKICYNRTEHCNKYTCINASGQLYDPKHCIVVYDGAGNAVAYIESCFSCDESQVWPHDEFGPRCGDFVNDLRYFYKSIGFPVDHLHLDHAPMYVADSVEIWKGK